MKLEIASAKAIRYAIMNWHYSKAVPFVQLAYAVFNDANEWCGVICYSIGANNNISKPYGLKQGEVIELVRVALNGKQESVSKALSISLKLLKKDAPLCKLVVSYADTEQGHLGIIYQASNWYYTGNLSGIPDEYIYKGKRYHGRSFRKIFGSHTKFLGKVDFSIVKGSEKRKYIYPLTKEMRLHCEQIKKPYPKNEQALSGEVVANSASDLD